jgi:hypothetical protein
LSYDGTKTFKLHPYPVLLSYDGTKAFKLHPYPVQECPPLNQNRTARLPLARRSGKVTVAAASLTRTGIYGCVTTGRFMLFSVITNIYNKKPKGPTIMELFTATEKLKKFFFSTTRDFR